MAGDSKAFTSIPQAFPKYSNVNVHVPLLRQRLDTMQAGGASRVGQEVKEAAEQSPCEADSAEGAMSRLGNYLGSWVGLGSVPENTGVLLCAASGV